MLDVGRIGGDWSCSSCGPWRGRFARVFQAASLDVPRLYVRGPSLHVIVAEYKGQISKPREQLCREPNARGYRSQISKPHTPSHRHRDQTPEGPKALTSRPDTHGASAGKQASLVTFVGLPFRVCENPRDLSIYLSIYLVNARAHNGHLPLGRLLPQRPLHVPAVGHDTDTPACHTVGRRREGLERAPHRP